ncbi:universal stress protein [Nocardia asteroides]|uniref:universal stress protein n=1 Tax=Nocardia asteroides TaxID=1824 RepID=UPI001E5CEA54|nr:universal stress protein [Nocardia asteroides]UGT62729.1 universal stress protein [Nocardia asteroides]
MTVRSDEFPPRVAAPIVAGVDGSAGSDRAVRWAAATAAARGRTLRLVHAVDLEPVRALTGAAPLVGGLRVRAGEVLLAAAELAAATAPEVRVRTELAEGAPAGALIDRSAGAHLVVLGATGTGGTAAHLGSTLLAVGTHADGAVVVVRDREFDRRRGPAGPVVLGVDGGAAGAPAIAAAFAEASARGADLVALHSWIDLPYGEFAGASDGIDDPELAETAKRMLCEQLAGWSEKYPEVEVRRELYLSGPRHHLLRWSRAAQLLVVGSRGRGGFAGLLFGSTSNALVQRAHCPVLVAHGG